MEKRNVKKILIFSGLFLVGALIIIGSGYYKSSLPNETATIKLNLKGEEVKPVVFDIANEGIPKRIVQPGKVTISTGHGTGIVNDTDKPIPIQVKAEGFLGDVDITSKDKSFDENTGSFSKSLEVGKGLNLNLTVNIPRSSINTNVINEGKIKFINTDSGEVIKVLPVKFVNSNEK